MFNCRVSTINKRLKGQQVIRTVNLNCLILNTVSGDIVTNYFVELLKSLAVEGGNFRTGFSSHRDKALGFWNRD